jgi:hypothetical protein
MTPIIHRLMVIRDHLDRIERADGADALGERESQLIGGLLASVQSRFDGIREFVPDVKPSEPEAA